MQRKNTYLIIAGFLNLLTAFVHLIGGQFNLVNPMLKSDLTSLEKSQQLGVWHMVTVLLFYSSFILIKKGVKPNKNAQEMVKYIAYSYVLYSLCFIGASIYQTEFAPQWTLLLPIGVLALIGNKKMV